MSKLQKINIKATDECCIKASIDALGWKDLGQGNHSIGYYEARGRGIDTGRGVFVIDNKGEAHYESDMLKSSIVNRFMARYGAEKTKVEALRNGYTVTEKVENGKIKILATEVSY